MAINESNKEQYREEYLDFLKNSLKEHCNSDMYYEIYWDYRDEIDASSIKEAVDNYKEAGYEKPIDYLVNKIWELNMDYDSNMFDEIQKEVLNCDNEHVVEYFEAYGDLREDAYSVGYNGIDVNIDDILSKTSLCINIMFATDNERNYDMGSIVSSFGSYRGPDYEYIAEDLDVLDNAVVYFIHQQGHSVKEVYDCLVNNPQGFGFNEKMDFAKAVVNDIVNNSSEAMSELCALVRVNGNEYFELMETLNKGEGYLSLSEKTEMGIFNEWSGCGGPLEFQLDKPFVVPVDMVRNVQIEGVKNDYGYSVDSVYGLIGDCWKESLSYTDEKSVLYEEDLAATINSVMEYIAEQEALEQENDVDELIADATERSEVGGSRDSVKGKDSLEMN